MSGRDVESIIRDLVEVSISNLHSQRLEAVKSQAEVAARDRLLTYLLEQTDSERRAAHEPPQRRHAGGTAPRRNRRRAATTQRQRRQRKKLLEMLNQELLEDVTVEIDVEQFYDDYNDDGPYDESSYGDFLDDLSRNAPRRRSRRVSVRDARRILTQQEAYRMVDFDAVVDESIRRAEDAAVVFIDEIDKTISRNGEYGADVSGEGVQRDLAADRRRLGRDDALRPGEDGSHPLHRGGQLPRREAIRPDPRVARALPAARRVAEPEPRRTCSPSSGSRAMH